MEWSRLEPEEGAFDAEAADRYEAMIAACEKNGLMPMVTLHHFTSPLWFAKQGGFSSAHAANSFGRFTAFVAKRLGARIPMWCTINEPLVLVVGTYLGKFMPPADHSPLKAALACEGLLKSHVRAYDTLHAGIPGRKGPWKIRPIEVGFAHNLLDFMPERLWHPAELLVTFFLERFYNRAWLDAVTGAPQNFGIPGFVPPSRTVPEARGRKTADFIGVNYYTKCYVRWKPRLKNPLIPAEVPINLYHAHPEEPQSDMGWAVHPKGFARVLDFVRGYGLPIYVTENGIADRDDRSREDYLLSHLEVLAAAIEKGADIRGYFHWSLLDNFEWIHGFKERFGLYHVNYDTQERVLKKSGSRYAGIVKTHRGKAPRHSFLRRAT